MHYKDGTPAAIGDTVKGKPYNTPKEIVGIMVSITLGSESCNCKVAFLELKEIIEVLDCIAPFIVVDTQGVRRCVVTKIDYGQCSDFLKVM